MNEFGEILRELRIKAGRTQQEVSEVVGVSRSRIGHIELGRQVDLPQGRLKALAEFFGVSLLVLEGLEPVPDVLCHRRVRRVVSWEVRCSEHGTVALCTTEASAKLLQVRRDITCEEHLG